MFGRIRAHVLHVLRLLVVGDREHERVRPAAEALRRRPSRCRSPAGRVGALPSTVASIERGSTPDAASETRTRTTPAAHGRAEQAGGRRTLVVDPEAEPEPVARGNLESNTRSYVPGAGRIAPAIGRASPYSSTYGLMLTGRPAMPTRRFSSPSWTTRGCTFPRSTATPKFATARPSTNRKTCSGPGCVLFATHWDSGTAATRRGLPTVEPLYVPVRVSVRVGRGSCGVATRNQYGIRRIWSPRCSTT